METLIGVIIGIVATWFFAWLYFRKGKKSKSIIYTKFTNQIVGNLSEKESSLKIYYNDLEIESLWITKIVLWNNGNQSIKPTDYSDSAKLSLTYYNSDVLDIEEYSDNISPSFFKLLPTEKYKVPNEDEEIHIVKFDFEFIPPKTGIIIKLKHSQSNRPRTYISGRLIDYGEATFKPISDIGKESKMKFFGRLKEEFFYYFVAIGVPAIYFTKSYDTEVNFTLFDLIFILSFGLVCLIVMILGIRKTTTSISMPKELEDKFFE